MKRPQFSIRLPRWHEWLVYGSTGLLFVTGAAWLLLDRFGKAQGEFGPEPNHALPWLLLIHGSAAYAFTVIAAMLVPVHMRLGWKSRRNRRSGLLLIAISLYLMLSGLTLYYSTAETFRSAASLSHLTAGIAIPILVLIHLARGKGSRPKRPRRRAREAS